MAAAVVRHAKEEGEEEREEEVEDRDGLWKRSASDIAPLAIADLSSSLTRDEGRHDGEEESEALEDIALASKTIQPRQSRLEGRLRRKNGKGWASYSEVVHCLLEDNAVHIQPDRASMSGSANRSVWDLSECQVLFNTKKKNRFRILKLQGSDKKVAEDVALMAENVEEAYEWKYAILASQEAYSIKSQVQELEELYMRRLAQLSSSLQRERRSTLSPARQACVTIRGVISWGERGGSWGNLG
eukprot:764885-Hanusia_phi.AAC.2